MYKYWPPIQPWPGGSIVRFIEMYLFTTWRFRQNYELEKKEPEKRNSGTKNVAASRVFFSLWKGKIINHLLVWQSRINVAAVRLRLLLLLQQPRRLCKLLVQLVETLFCNYTDQRFTVSIWNRWRFSIHYTVCRIFPTRNPPSKMVVLENQHAWRHTNLRLFTFFVSLLFHSNWWQQKHTRGVCYVCIPMHVLNTRGGGGEVKKKKTKKETPDVSRQLFGNFLGGPPHAPFAYVCMLLSSQSPLFPLLLFYFSPIMISPPFFHSSSSFSPFVQPLHLISLSSCTYVPPTHCYDVK